jgi:MoaA/NifB/PqqE/SkfB family radical SAM enzyme
MRSTSINPAIIHGYRAKLVRLGIRLTVLKLAIQVYKNPVVGFNALRKLIKKNLKLQGEDPDPRYVKLGSRYSWSCDFPGWPSKIFNEYIKRELNREKKINSVDKSLQTIIFAITNRCPLKCRHCYEWDKLDIVDKLSLDELKQILQKIHAQGIYHVQLSGGEPLVRFDDMVNLIKSANQDTEFWMLTSGFGLTSDKAVILKKVGLTGVNISLDHWDENKHNEFRNNDKSFKWVKEAAANCKDNDISVSLSLCATKEFISEENLLKYIQLAKDLRADFIRILEPRSVGRFANSDVQLDKSQRDILERFYLKIGSDSKYKNYPVLSYPGYHQKKFGCFGAGNRYLYIDSNADFHACPFCLQEQGNAIKDSFESALRKLKSAKCHAFKMNCED